MGMLHQRDYISTAYIFEKWSEQPDDFFFYWIDNNRKELVAWFSVWLVRELSRPYNQDDDLRTLY